MGRLVRRRPLALTLACLAILGAGALGNLEGRGYLDLSEQYRTQPESVAGQELIRERFEPRRARRAGRRGGRRAAPRCPSRMRSPRRRGSPRPTPTRTPATLISLQVLLDLDPFSTEAMDQIPRLRAVAREAAGGETALVGGVTATNHDNLEALHSDALLIVPLVLAVILVVLVVLLRSLVAPLYVIGTVVLSFAFALGASSLLFTHVLGQPDWTPRSRSSRSSSSSRSASTTTSS